jgi:ATP-dependent RNA helicase DDX56/DBP9
MEAGFSLKKADWKDYGLDERIVQGIAALHFSKPTAVQAACIPLALKGKDLLARANTGTGKTAAYSLPILQKIIKDKKVLNVPHIRAVILVPTRDLSSQVEEMIKRFTKFLRKDVTCFNILSEDRIAARLPMLKAKPDIVITTPSALFQHLSSRTIDISQLSSLVVDEADLVLAGSNQVTSIRGYIPQNCQTYMMSATLSEDVMEVKGKLMNSPFIIKLQEQEDEEYKVRQYYLTCPSKDKYMVLLGMLMTGDIEGKTLIFIHDVNSATKLQIFLDLFKIPCAILNSEVPENSRNHIVRQFNEGKFKHLIATDESLRLDDIAKRKADLESSGKQKELEQEAQGVGKKRKRSASVVSTEPAIAGDRGLGGPPVKRMRLQDKINALHEKEQQAGEYGMHRGIDFKNVGWVINFDTCDDASTYTHRIGRTGRGAKHGNALSLFNTAQQEDLLEYIQQDQAARGKELKEYPVPAAHWEKLRVRTQDVLECIKRSDIKAARIASLAREVVNSEQLQAHFKDSPEDLKRLNHLAIKKPKAARFKYMHYLPSYLGLTRAVEGEKKGKDGSSKPMEKRRLIKKLQKEKTRRPRKGKDPLKAKVGSYERAMQAEKRMSLLDLEVVDPAALHKKRKARNVGKGKSKKAKMMRKRDEKKTEIRKKMIKKHLQNKRDVKKSKA